MANNGGGSAIATITNDDNSSAPVITLSPMFPSVIEGNSGTRLLTMTASLSSAAASTVTVNYATSDADATAGSDYVAANGVLTFAPGETTKTFSIVVNGDNNYESNESFFINLSSPTGATLANNGGGSAIATITNDDNSSLQDITSPTVTIFSPTDEATGIAIGSNIVVTFSETIVKGTGNIVLKSSTGAIVATYDAATSSNIAISGNTLTINPTSDLAYSTSYKVDFAVGTVKDLAGNAYAGTTSYNFTTKSSPTIFGGPGNDILTGGSGSLIDGFAGVDTVTYTGNRGSLIHNPNGTWTVGSDTLTNIERLQFADTKVAIDIDGNAGKVAKILAAVFGASAVSNKEYVGIGLNLIDGGMSYESLSALALNAAGANSREAVVDLLWFNLMGSRPTADQAKPFIDMLSPDLSNVGTLGAIAADHAAVVGIVNLNALSQTGLEFI